MKTWVLCAEETSAKVYTSDDLSLGIEFIKSISKPEELEGVCGADETDTLLICGKPSVVSRLCQRLSDGLRSRIVGIIPQDLAHASIERLRFKSQRATAGKFLHAGLHAPDAYLPTV